MNLSVVNLRRTLDRLSCGIGCYWVQDTSEQLHEACQLKLEISKLAANLGWHPALPLELGLEITADWMYACAKGFRHSGNYS